jgi:phytoene/squalene synthetase
METKQTDFIQLLNRIDFESIQKHPNILVAASFWDEERYRAAKVCYKFMRDIDDLIDDYKAAHKTIREKDRQRFVAKVEEWVSSVSGSRSINPFKRELAATIRQFRIPMWPIETFAKSMIYDIGHDGFPTVNSFLDYAGGASVAPSSIFVHLCGIRKIGDVYLDPLFDVRSAAQPCANFSYLVHIIRDFQKDQYDHLNYFADDRIEANGLTREELSRIAHGAPVSQGFRSLIREYYELADSYRKDTLKVISEITPLVEPRYQLSLNIIFNLYLMVFERIDPDHGKFTALELNPTPAEIRKRVEETIYASLRTFD